VKCRRRITLGMLVVAAFACADRDAELREEFREASLALVDHRVPGSKKNRVWPRRLAIQLGRSAIPEGGELHR